MWRRTQSLSTGSSCSRRSYDIPQRFPQVRIAGLAHRSEPRVVAVDPKHRLLFRKPVAQFVALREDALGPHAVVVAGVLSSAVAAFFYIRVIVMIFFSDPEEDTVTVTIPSLYTNLTIWIAAIATLALGIFPAPFLDFIATFATFTR